MLNSLAGDESIEASLLCLGKGGRFVEIGSINIWSAERMTKARPDVDYTIIKAVGEQGSELEQTQVQFKMSCNVYAMANLSRLIIASGHSLKRESNGVHVYWPACRQASSNDATSA